MKISTLEMILLSGLLAGCASTGNLRRSEATARYNFEQLRLRVSNDVPDEMVRKSVKTVDIFFYGDSVLMKDLVNGRYQAMHLQRYRNPRNSE